MKKVLIITYYWPPAGGGPIQRWLKFTKYLRDFGWEPVIYTALHCQASGEDPSLLDEIPDGVEVIRQPIWEPYDLYRKFTGKKKESNVHSFIDEGGSKFREKISRWLRGNIFLPDPKLFWVRPSVKYLSNYIKYNQVHAIVSNGPPHSVHLIAKKLKKKTGLPWLADFRDPWTNINFYHKLYVSKPAHAFNISMERKVVQTADIVTTVSSNWAKEFEDNYNRDVEIITNGFDPADFLDHDVEMDKEFSLMHIGTMDDDRNPTTLLNVLGELCQESDEFKKALCLRLIGPTDSKFFHHANKNGLTDNIEHIPFTHHADVLKVLPSAQVLLLCLNRVPNIYGIIPGKLYEYLAARRPILCTGLIAGDSGNLLREIGTGMIVDFEDHEGTKKAVVSLFEKYKAGELKAHDFDISKYDRRELTGSMARLLDRIVENNPKFPSIKRIKHDESHHISKK